MSQPISIYIHYPYCIKKCPYCDFNSHTTRTVLDDDYGALLLRELAYYRARFGAFSLKSIFFGGGTPSLMPPVWIERLISACHQAYSAEQAEITLEANSGTVDINRLNDIKSAGVNRLSLGVQALDDKSLKKLGRIHDKAQAISAIEHTKNLFANWSMDLIYARPWQTMHEWHAELAQSLAFDPPHISLYQLTIETGTDFHRRARLGMLKEISNSKAARLFSETRTTLAAHGLPAYEVSNHAKPNLFARHNMTYWQMGQWFGIGAGAHSRMHQNDPSVPALSIVNERLPKRWAELVRQNQHSISQETPIDQATDFKERLMMGLRLSQGIRLSPHESESIAQKWQVLNQSGYAHPATEHDHRLTEDGIARLNAILLYLTD